MLSRIRNNFRQANWPTLLLELLVLVTGIWGAFQLERWGEDRREARQETVYLQQLHEETLDAIASAASWQEDYEWVMALVYPTILELQKPPGSGPLSDEQCQSLFQVSILAWDPMGLITLEEMVNSGWLAAMEDMQLKSQLFNLLASQRSMDSQLTLMRGQQNVLMDMYPQLMPRRVDEAYEAHMRCDADGMRLSTAFINHLMSNRGRYQSLMQRFSGQVEQLEAIHLRLDTLLSLAHPGAG